MDVSEIISELNDHGFEDTTTPRKESVINDTIADVCAREPWPFLEKNITLTFAGSSETASNWPADFAKALSLVNPSTGQTIQYERREVVRKQYASTLTQAGVPFVYSFLGGQARFYPLAGSSDTISMDYICSHPEVTSSTVESGILIPARHHRILVVGSLVKLYAMEDDPELSALFQEQFEDRLFKMREDLMRLQYDRPDRIFVLDNDDFFDDSYPVI